MSERNMKGSSIAEIDMAGSVLRPAPKPYGSKMHLEDQSSSSYIKRSKSILESSQRDGHLFSKTNYRLVPIPSLPKIKTKKSSGKQFNNTQLKSESSLRMKLPYEVTM